jgi:two-component system cell cycle sensor histidine kinase/response regulator CckA
MTTAEAKLKKKITELRREIASFKNAATSAGELPFENIIRNHNVSVIITNPESGKILDVNIATEKFYGLSRSKLIGKNITELFAVPQDEIASILVHNKPVCVVAHKINSGEIRQVEMHTSVIKVGKSEFSCSIIHDVTEQIEADQQLQYRQALESLISSISTYFIRPDHHEINAAIKKTLQSVGEFVNVDQSFIIQFSEDLATFRITHNWHCKGAKVLQISDGTATDDFPRLTGNLLRGENFDLAKLDKSANEKAFFARFNTKSALIMPMIAAGMVTGGIGFCTRRAKKSWDDDTLTLLRMVGEIIINTLSRKHTEDALRASELKYRRFFEEDLTADFIASVNGRIRFCNPAFVKIFGFESKEEALKSNLNDLDARTSKLKDIITSLKKTGEIKNKEIELLRKDGEPLFLVGNFRGTFDEQGNLTESTGYMFDITEHKRVEEQFRGAQKMEAIGRLAGGVAHDFNNLLTVINGYSDLLLNSDFLKDTDLKRVQLIKRAGDRAAALTGQLLAFSRKQIVQPKKIDLNTVIIEFEKMLRRLIGENIEVVNHLQNDLKHVKIDPTQLEQIIINLAVNARDAMPSGGKLEICTYNKMLDAKFIRKHRPIEPGEYVVLEMSDTGTGMDKDTMSNIFEPFFTTKEKGKGTGLGLSTIYGIVKQAKGYIWVESKPGKGSTFFIYFPPMVKDEIADDKAVQYLPDETLKGNERILVVEDDRLVRELTSSFLESYGYTVSQAQSARDALAYFEQNKNHFNLIIIDVVMPDMGGKQLSQEIRKKFPEHKILFISGYTDNDIVKYGVLNDEVKFLQKPFTAAQLGKKVRQVLDS